MIKIRFFLFNVFLVHCATVFADDLSTQSCLNQTNNISNCLQSKINLAVEKKHKFKLESGVYVLDNTLNIPSNFYLDGNNATLVVSQKNGLKINSESNVVIKNLTLDGKGMFYNTPIQYQANKKLIGFSNLVDGVSIINSSNIQLINNKFIGLGRGIVSVADNAIQLSNISIINNNFINLGMTGIFALNINKLIIQNNTIKDIWGNGVVSESIPLLNKSKFADGIYLGGSKNIIIKNNIISNIERIGIVLDNVYDKTLDIGMVNDNILIESNQISNLNSSRGTENNAGIWIEPIATKDNPKKYITNNVIIKNNVISNLNANYITNHQYGIFAGGFNVNMEMNDISYFKDYGIYCVFGNIKLNNNKLKSNGVNLFKNKKPLYLNIN